VSLGVPAITETALGDLMLVSAHFSLLVAQPRKRIVPLDILLNVNTCF
jgi:hypothetical protein